MLHKYTGQRQEAGIGLYFYGARWYDPALGRFTQPDTIVPSPGDAAAFDRYAYVLNNPLRYSDPSGHEPCPTGAWGDCRPNRSYAENYRLARYYVDLNVDWSDIPADAQAVMKAGGETEGTYSDLAPSVQVQTGLRDPATLAASLFGIGRLVLQLPALLTPCIDDACDAEIRTFDMAVKRVDSVVSFQKLGGFSRDVLTKGYHLNSTVGEVSLLPQKMENDVIQIIVNPAGSTTGAITGKIVQGVADLLQSDPAGALQRAQGIITTFGSDSRYAERVRQAQLLVEALTNGKYTVVK